MLTLLEKLQAIARTGLAYTRNPYDKERYLQLLELATSNYEDVLPLSSHEVSKRLSLEFGYITPKVGVEAAIFLESSEILLVQRSDNNRWGLPGGWIEPCEAPEDTIVREVKEETGLDVMPLSIVHAFGESPDKYGMPHSQVIIVYACKVIGGECKLNHEVNKVKYQNIENEINWHENHKKHAAVAKEYWEKQFHKSLRNL